MLLKGVCWADSSSILFSETRWVVNNVRNRWVLGSFQGQAFLYCHLISVFFCHLKMPSFLNSSCQIINKFRLVLWFYSRSLGDLVQACQFENVDYLKNFAHGCLGFLYDICCLYNRWSDICQARVKFYESLLRVCLVKSLSKKVVTIFRVGCLWSHRIISGVFDLSRILIVGLGSRCNFHCFSVVIKFKILSVCCEAEAFIGLRIEVGGQLVLAGLGDFLKTIEICTAITNPNGSFSL